MKKQNKSKISTITLILMFTISALIITLPTSNAQEPMRLTTYAVIGATPNPIGVNQMVLIHLGITQYLGSAQYGWSNLTVTVTKPDGEIENLGSFGTDATGSTGTTYIPTQIGTYYLQTHFPEQAMPANLFSFFGMNIPAGSIMEASDSDVLSLVVTEEQREYYPGNSLPLEYWNRPIDAQLREWSVISGNWLTGAGRGGILIEGNEYAPESAHVLWAKEMQMGGLAGGDTGEHAFECGDAYEGLFAGSIIIGGNLYYNHYKSGFPTQEVVAVDLHTGEELWCKPLLDKNGNSLRVSFGQTFYWDSYNYHAVFPYLWATSGNTWYAFDPFDGQYAFSLAGVPSGTTIYGPKGDIYRYSVNTNSATMTLWNLSRCVSNEGSWLGGFSGAGFREHNATNGIEWTIDIPEGLQGSASLVELGNIVVGNSLSPTTITSWAFSLQPGQEGELLFNNTRNAPSSWSEGNIELRLSRLSLEDDIFTVFVAETRQRYGFSISTGNLVWGPTDPQFYLDWLVGTNDALAYGNLYSVGYGGIVYCYNIANGELKWTYNATDPFTEILWADNWPLRIQFVTDGKIYIGHEEHSPIDPKPRGAPYLCLNATTGNLIWRADGLLRQNHWGGDSIIGDSIIAGMNSYDQRIYAIGKGPSEVTVTAGPIVVDAGTSQVIMGTILDISPGTEDYSLRARFPKGVPVVSDEDMSEWMKYVYCQFARPTDVSGVPVKIEITNPNGENVWIGTAISDADGNFAYTWKPQIEGQYKIIATFDGSASYYGSNGVTYMAVDQASNDVNLDPIQGSVNEISSSVDNLGCSVNDLESCVTDLETSVSDLKNIEGSMDDLESSTSGFEASLSNLKLDIGNQTTFIIAILALVVISISVAVYAVTKTRK
jgi:outer membrane protein assembly factor BamB